MTTAAAIPKFAIALPVTHHQSNTCARVGIHRLGRRTVRKSLEHVARLSERSKSKTPAGGDVRPSVQLAVPK